LACTEISAGQVDLLVILNVAEGGVKDLLYLPFNIGAKRRSTNTTTTTT
jgi:hypothetical protein